MNPVLLTLLAFGGCAAIAAWTHYLMQKGMKVNQELLVRATDPHIAMVDTFKELNGHMVGLLEKSANRQELLLDRLFSAADRIGTPPPQLQSFMENPSFAPTPPRAVRDEDDETEADEALDAELKRARKAERRRDLEDRGVLTADPATV